MSLTSNEIRKRFLNFFESKKHSIVPSASLVPENDPSVLFNTAGMQPLVPYLLGEKHPKGKRIANVQKCIRTNDIDEVGDKTHCTFFEMLGNWSLGDYFKKEAISWSFEFLTSKENGLALDPARLYVTVFEGNNDAPKDNESYEIWKEIFENVGLNPEERIFWLSAEGNWWAPGDNGPCGPDSEMFYDRTEQGLGGLTHGQFLEADEKMDVVEIWNDVFMEYDKKDGKIIGKLESKNVDTGAGLERVTAILQGKESHYETDLFIDAIELIEKKTNKKYLDNKKDFRIILDHIRSSVFMVADGVVPSNKDQGYILRRLLRRAIVKMKNIDFNFNDTEELILIFINKYGSVYENLIEKKELIILEIIKEIQKFEKTITAGLREFEKIVDPNTKNNNIKKLDFGEIEIEGFASNEISGEDAFKLFSTYGFPIELIKEEAEKRNVCIDCHGFKKRLKEHSEKSQTSSAGKFKGGMGGDTPKVRAMHTATHLLLEGLRRELGKEVAQAGSNITDERIRFDFTYSEKAGREVLDKVEEYVNSAIEVGAEIITEEMEKEKAKSENVVGAFWEKYPDIVKVWTIKDKEGNIYSKELCGGPHVKNTLEISEFGKFKIGKEKSSSAGIRRIKATLEK